MATAHIQDIYYSNYLMVSKDGQPITTINKRRCEWYLKRGLAKEINWPDKQYPKVVQLNFVHKGSVGRRESDTAHVETQCVVCGSREKLSLHHVVPHSIKKHYKTKDKDYTRHLCVLLCEKHHLEIEKENQKINVPKNDWVHRHIKFINNIIDKYRGLLYRISSRLWFYRLGGPENINKIFIDKFLEMKPKYLPKGWLK